MAFLMVAHKYQLNPLTREVYAFKSGGKVQPIVSIDGWMRIINSHPQMDGLETEEIFDAEGALSAVRASIYRKDRAHPVVVTEYMAECRRNTPVWQQWPVRMLRHKAVIQAARYAFGFADIVDPDEAERIKEETTERDITPHRAYTSRKPKVEPIEIEPESITQEELDQFCAEEEKNENK